MYSIRSYHKTYFFFYFVQYKGFSPSTCKTWNVPDCLITGSWRDCGTFRKRSREIYWKLDWNMSCTTKGLEPATLRFADVTRYHWAISLPFHRSIRLALRGVKSNRDRGVHIRTLHDTRCQRGPESVISNAIGFFFLAPLEQQPTIES